MTTIRTITDAADREWGARQELHEWGQHRELVDWCPVCQLGVERFRLEHSVWVHHPDDPSAPLQEGCPPCDEWRTAHPSRRSLGPQSTDDGPVTIQPADEGPGYAIPIATRAPATHHAPEPATYAWCGREFGATDARATDAPPTCSRCMAYVRNNGRGTAGAP